MDLFAFAHAAGDYNPLHLATADKDEDGRVDGDQDTTAPSLWIAALFSGLIGNELPGPGARIARAALEFLRPVRVGEELTLSLEVAALEPPAQVRLLALARASDGAIIATGEIEAIAPDHALTLHPDVLPELIIARHEKAERLMAACDGLPALATAVAAPHDALSLGGALGAAARHLIKPLLVGDRAKIETLAAAQGLSLAGAEIIDCPDPAQIPALAVRLVLEGRAQAVMKGALHTDDLMRAVVAKEGGLRGQRRISHVFTFDVPGIPYLLHVSDAAIAIAPSLKEKVDITQNAIDLARALGSARPRVGVLSAVETVNPKIPSTVDAAEIAAMAARGEISGGDVQGPLAMDNAISVEAARTKGITGLVAGRAEVLIVPNLEAGNILAKQLSFISHAEGAGLVLGARAPVILTSRADDEPSRLLSCAMAVLYEHWQRTGAPAAGLVEA
jgi:phosphate butyryltransferase